MNASKRADQLFAMPFTQMPAGCRGVAEYLGRKYGLCAEVCLSAYRAYAVAVEQLPCEDS